MFHVELELSKEQVRLDNCIAEYQNPNLVVLSVNSVLLLSFDFIPFALP